MSKITTTIDDQIAKAKVNWQGTRSRIADALSPISDLQKHTAELVSWSEFAILELKDRLTASDIIIKGLREELAELRKREENRETDTP